MNFALLHRSTFCYGQNEFQFSPEVKMITLDDFNKIELKIATIKHAEPHPNADRLLVLKIELGSEERQLVAGIRGHYTVEELIGKQIVVVANMQPAMLRGVESQGMLLAARDGEGIVILTPEKRVTAGAKVS
ncbi:MAG: methionine--tRNA ligase subunit beta [Candidatus Binatia bacterium]